MLLLIGQIALCFRPYCTPLQYPNHMYVRHRCYDSLHHSSRLPRGLSMCFLHRAILTSMIYCQCRLRQRPCAMRIMCSSLLPPFCVVFWWQANKSYATTNLRTQTFDVFISLNSRLLFYLAFSSSNFLVASRGGFGHPVVLRWHWVEMPRRFCPRIEDDRYV